MGIQSSERALALLQLLLLLLLQLLAATTAAALALPDYSLYTCYLCDRYSPERQLELLRDESFERVVFVRNPYTRLFSAWRDKFQGTAEQCRTSCSMAYLKYWYTFARRILEYSGLSVEEIAALRKDKGSFFAAVTWPRFLKAVLARKVVDRHWRDQMEETHACAFRPTFLGKQEHGNDDVTALLEKFNFTGALPSAARKNSREGVTYDYSGALFCR